MKPFIITAIVLFVAVPLRAAIFTGVEPPTHEIGSSDISFSLEEGEPVPDQVIWQLWNEDQGVIASKFQGDPPFVWKAEELDAALSEEVDVSLQVLFRDQDERIFHTEKLDITMVPASSEPAPEPAPEVDAEAILLRDDEVATVHLLIQKHQPGEMDVAFTGKFTDEDGETVILFPVGGITIDDTELVESLESIRSRLRNIEDKLGESEMMPKRRNINTITEQELFALMNTAGVWQPRSKAALVWWSIHPEDGDESPVRNRDDLLAIKGIGEKTVEDLEPYIKYED